jgi:hypothetical protein
LGNTWNFTDLKKLKKITRSRQKRDLLSVRQFRSWIPSGSEGDCGFHTHPMIARLGEIVALGQTNMWSPRMLDLVRLRVRNQRKRDPLFVGMLEACTRRKQFRQRFLSPHRDSWSEILRSDKGRLFEHTELYRTWFDAEFSLEPWMLLADSAQGAAPVVIQQSLEFSVEGVISE